ncbi:MAG: hypothetical protein HQL54_11405 [Magnetococcales bacterium]|nr:hypothetical protein [Magnetococcales bacterium]
MIHANDANAVIITHATNNSTTHTKSAMRAIFGMRVRQWSDGKPIKVFVLPDSALLHKQFCKQKLNVFPYQLRRIWNRLVYTGTGHAPIEVADEQEMARQIAQTPGAIGYIHLYEADHGYNAITME